MPAAPASVVAVPIHPDSLVAPAPVRWRRQCREAPVTSATLDAEFVMQSNSLASANVARIVQRAAPTRPASMRLGQACQHLARATHEVVTPRACSACALDPAHRAEGLAVLRVANGPRLAPRPHPRYSPPGSAAHQGHTGQRRRAAFRPGLHQAGMEGADTGRAARASAPAALRTSKLCRHRPGTRNHGLNGVVEVHRLNHFSGATRQTTRSPPAQPAMTFRTQPGDGGGASAHGHNLLHGGGTQAHQRRGLGQRLSTPEATSAEYSPSECPATATGAAPPWAPHTMPRRRPQHHRLGVGGSVPEEPRPGPSWIRRPTSSPGHRTPRATLVSALG